MSDLSAAPAALIGVGTAGGRLIARTRERFRRESALNADGLLLLSPDGGSDALPKAVRQAALHLMRQRSVSALEQRFSIRSPSRRYVTLHLVFAAALAETDADTLLLCLDAAFALNHPAAGMEILFLLDVTAADGDGITPDAAPVLRRLEEEGRRRRDNQGQLWSASARLRVLLAHPHRADGSRLDHPCLALSPEGISAEEMPGTSVPPEDEFEETLAAALAGHVAAGPFFDGLAAGPQKRPFALWGSARDVLPREHILEAVTDRLVADAVERTAAPEQGADASSLGAASLCGEYAPDTWQAWVRTRDDVLLDRRSLLTRLLVAGRPGAIAVDDAPPSAPPRRSLYAWLFRWFWGEPPSLASTAGTAPLRVRLGLPSPGWQTGDPKAWPAALQSLDGEGAKACDALIEELRTQDRPAEAAEEVCLALARCLDVCVRRHLGGAQAGRQIVAEALQSAREQIAAAGSIPFATPPPVRLGLPDGAGFSAAWDVYRERCAKQPAWPAALSAGLSYGALGMAALAAFGLPVLLFGWPYTAACLLFAAGRQAMALGRLTRLGNHLHECVRAKYGHRLFDWAQQAAGVPDHPGVYQAIIHYLEEWELPAVEQFEAEREAMVARLRRPQPFPPPSGTDEFLADERAVPDLHGVVREAGGEAATADDARTLLRQQDLFADWRVPALDRRVAAARPFLRRARLAAWERSERSLGEFLRGILTPYLPAPGADAAFAAWVRRRMDHLALRSIPLALLPPSHPERHDEREAAESNTGGSRPEARAGDVVVSVTVVAPGSLGWSAENAASASDLDVAPIGSGVQDLIAWFGVPSPANRVVAAEADETACLVLLSGLSASEALSAFPFAEDSVVAPLRLEAVFVNGSNGHALRSAGEVPREAAAEGGAA